MNDRKNFRTYVDIGVNLKNASRGVEKQTTSFYPELLERYREMIQKGIAKKRFPETETGSGEHLLWMLDELGSSDQSLTKKHRWLGFIQCSIIAAGMTTVQIERDFTREIFKGD